MPAENACASPWFWGNRMTWSAPARRATSAVPSCEPSSMTSTSTRSIPSTWRGSAAIVAGSDSASFRLGIWMMSFGMRCLRGLALVALLSTATAASNSFAAPGPAPPSLRVLFLRVDFPDHPSTRSADTLAGPGRNGLLDRFTDYWAEVSSGRFHIEPMLARGVFRLPEPRIDYSGATRRLVGAAIEAATRPRSASREAIAAFRPEAVVVLFAGPGSESELKPRTTGSPWSEAIRGGEPFDVAGREVDLVMVVGEDPLNGLSPFGVLAHEFGHLLGLPELYAPSHAHSGIGTWGLMGEGTWVGRGDRPPHPCAWSKLRLGWVDPIVVEHDRHVRLEAVERVPKVVKILAREGHPEEYFLVENRRRIGSDGRIPGEGLLVWHVDDSLDSFRRSQDDPNHKRVDLLTADAWPSHLDLGPTRGGNRGDAGDPWSDRLSGPGPDTRPSTASYAGARGRFSLRNVSPAGEAMTFDVVFEDETRDASGRRPASAPPVSPPPAPVPARSP